MFTKDNDTKITYSFFILLNQWYEFPAPKLTNFHIFIIPLLLNVTFFFLRIPWLNILNYETGCIGGFSEKTTDKSMTIAAAKMELFVVLVGSFQLLPNFTNNPNIGSLGILNAPLEHFNRFWNLCRWSNKYCRTVASNRF